MDIGTILNMPVIGNAHNDQGIFNAVDSFIIDPANLMSDKVLCIRKLDETMGETADSYSEADVIEYIAER